jgi:hypothetical protein
MRLRKRLGLLVPLLLLCLLIGYAMTWSDSQGSLIVEEKDVLIVKEKNIPPRVEKAIRWNSAWVSDGGESRTHDMPASIPRVARGPRAR